ncbi:MAG: hypothetical protein H6618_07195 [Deltaproteobacteria bacterium]|nr:hypothetical protein [Deltaproteobacteria bacterium]
MGTEFFIHRRKKSRSRQVPVLPRIGIYIDWAGYETVFKYSPLLEALLQLQEKGISVYNLIRISKEHLSEITFPERKKSVTIDTTARVIKAHPDGDS